MYLSMGLDENVLSEGPLGVELILQGTYQLDGFGENMEQDIKIIGIDCATDVTKTGLSVGRYINGVVELLFSTTGTKDQSVAKTVNSWIEDKDRVLIAMDAPLGWPEQMGKVLKKHQAGETMNIKPSDLFQRETDRFVRKQTGKKPLEVGADRIARTAHAALKILHELSQLQKEPIQMAWLNQNITGMQVIEVYPAATLEVYGIQSKGYKKKQQLEQRRQMIQKLKKHLVLHDGLDLLVENADALDSVVCLLSARDFLAGEVYEPKNPSLAKKEGWIWVKKSNRKM